MAKDKATPPRNKWKNIGIRSYERNVPKAQAFVFGAYRPVCLWAYTVYFSAGNSSGVENGFSRAKRKADELIAAVERDAMSDKPTAEQWMRKNKSILPGPLTDGDWEQIRALLEKYAAEVAVECTAPAPQPALEQKYRCLLWESHAGGTHAASLYGDDGEMQCNHAACMIDFKREPIEQIENKLWDMNLKGTE